MYPVWGAKVVNVLSSWMQAVKPDWDDGWVWVRDPEERVRYGLLVWVGNVVEDHDPRPKVVAEVAEDGLVYDIAVNTGMGRYVSTDAIRLVWHDGVPLPKIEIENDYMGYSAPMLWYEMSPLWMNRKIRKLRRRKSG